MAGTSLCVTCANLPIKARGAATSVQRCPDCNAEVGVTSYGCSFRIRAVKARTIGTPSLMTGVVVGVGLFAFVLVLLGLSVFSTEHAPQQPVSRFGQPPRGADAQKPATHEFAHVPEVGLPLYSSRKQDAAFMARQHAELFASAKQLNAGKRDGFLLAQIDKQPELRGLAFMMGDACRMKSEEATKFQTSVLAVRDAIDRDGLNIDRTQDGHGRFWMSYTVADRDGLNTSTGLAALTQILGPESKDVRVELMAKLSTSRHPDAIKVLTKAAIFDATPEARLAALKALKALPRDSQSGEILMYGMRHPMAEVMKRSAQAIITLDRQDLVPQLVALLGEAAPGDPVEAIVDEKPVCTVREVVRINHHRNCLLCHAPVDTGGAHEVPALAPTPGAPFPSIAREYYGQHNFASSPAVRADTTYLRQDFSVLMPVADAAPWPEWQRFDFLVRTRVVEGQKLAELQQAVRDRAKDEPQPHQEAAAHALRALTGKDAPATQIAWQRVLDKAE